MTSWSRAHIEKLKQEGKIRDFNIPEVKHETPAGRIVAKHFAKRSKEKDYLSWNLLWFANENALQLKEEYQFDLVNGRKWKADYCFEALKVLIEYEGLNAETSRHTTLKGYSGDSDKYREAAKQGWIVLRYTCLNYKNVLQDLRDILKK